MFSTPFLIEGWPLYWELRMWELGFPRSPEDRIGMLFWRSHRCARILFSLNFHLGKMTPEECVNLLVDRIGHERANATGEVRRSFDGNYGPLYQAAYLLGGLQLRALHGELVKTGKMTERAFHDAVLKEISIPIAMIRASAWPGSTSNVTARRRPAGSTTTPNWPSLEASPGRPIDFVGWVERSEPHHLPGTVVGSPGARPTLHFFRPGWGSGTVRSRLDLIFSTKT